MIDIISGVRGENNLNYNTVGWAEMGGRMFLKLKQFSPMPDYFFLVITFCSMKGVLIEMHVICNWWEVFQFSSIWLWDGQKIQ